MTQQCKEDVESLLRRPLSPEETQITEFLCGFDLDDVSILVAIYNRFCAKLILKIEAILGRKLVGDEFKEALRLVRDGLSVDEVVRKLNPEKTMKPK